MVSGRHLPADSITTFLNTLPKHVSNSIVGRSVNGLPINLLRLGTGEKRIFMWSQMHGNESTTTKAIVDLLEAHTTDPISSLLKLVTLYIIPQLNPDGCNRYTRENADTIDLNRDAIALTAPESKVLRAVFNRIQPHYCFNLHGQRTIYAAGKNGKTATLSFLAPAADENRSITPARKEAMQLIGVIASALGSDLPDQIGRYDDTFNPNCVGDSFTVANIPTLLFEAGHYPNDYPREKTRSYVYQALITAIEAIAHNTHLTYTTDTYFKIPENTKDFVDLIIAPIKIMDNGTRYNNQQLALQFLEVLEEGVLKFKPYYHSYGENLALKAHRFIKYDDLEYSDIIVYKQDKIIDTSLYNELFLTF